MSHAPPPRPGCVQLFAPAVPLTLSLPLLPLPGGIVNRSSSLGHTQPKGCQLLFAVHFAPFCCSSAAPFIIHRSSYCGTRYNAQLQHRRRAEYAGVVSHSVTPLRRRYEWHRGRKRVLALTRARTLAPLVRRAPACVHARVRVSVHRVYARQNTKWTRVRHGDVYCALVRCFIGVTLRDSFQYSSPSRASFNNAHYDNIPLWSELGGQQGGKANTPSQFWYLYTFDVGLARRASVKFANHARFLLGDNYFVIKPGVQWLSDAGWYRTQLNPRRYRRRYLGDIAFITFRLCASLNREVNYKSTDREHLRAREF